MISISKPVSSSQFASNSMTAMLPWSSAGFALLTEGVAIVITSYSIHYTKLYETAFGPLRVPRLGRGDCGGRNIDAEGVIRAKGIVNTREHLESLFEAKERGVASVQEYMAAGGQARRVA